MNLHAADVIVIGAGAAGLAAAGKLAEKGRRVAVLEARERLGGRIWTQQPAGWSYPLELGAEFIHGGNASLWRLMRKGRIGKRAVPQAQWLVLGDRRRLVPEAEERIQLAMRRIGPARRGDFGSWLRGPGRALPAEDHCLASGYVEGFEAAPLGRMSAAALFASAATGADGAQFRMDEGYDRLIAALCSGTPRRRASVWMKAVVSEIEWAERHVMVGAGTERWTAPAVVITIPLGVLQARPGSPGAIRFSPALRERRRLWNRLEPGHAVRLSLRLTADAWTSGVLPPDVRAEGGRGFGFIRSDRRDFPVWWTEAPHPVLVGWTGGSAAKRLAGLKPEVILRQALKTLAGLLPCDGPALEQLVVDWRMHDWTTDPFSRGAYTFAIAGEEDAALRLAQPIKDTLFFAGEATAASEELGTVHGAIASGERAAREVLERG